MILACRDVEKGEMAATEIRTRVGGAKVEVRELDLADISSIRSFAQKFLRGIVSERLSHTVTTANSQPVVFNKQVLMIPSLSFPLCRGQPFAHSD